MKNQPINNKKGLQNLPTYDPKPELWDKIESALEEQQKPRFAYMHWTIGIAATLALLLSINFLFNKSVDGQREFTKSEQQNQTELTAPRKNEPNYPKIENSVDQEDGDALIKVDKVQNGTASKFNGISTSDSVYLTNKAKINQGTLAYTWNMGDASSDVPVNVTIPEAYFTSPSPTFNLNTNVGTYSYSAPSTLHGYTSSGSYTVTTQNALGSTSGSIPDLHLDPNAIDGLFKETNKPEEAYEVIDYDMDDIDYESSAEDLSTIVQRGEMGNDPSGRGKFNVRSDQQNSESYAPLVENEYKKPQVDPLSTFGIDVDNASYAVMRSKINSGQFVPKDAVRVEEFVNYFEYSYPQPTNSDPFSVNMEMADCPWNKGHQLVRIGLKGKEIDYKNLSASNLVFLIDVSGSMGDENKLPLVKQSLKLLVDQMGKNDRIAIVTYAGAAGLALPSTTCDEKEFIKKKIDKLESGGSTAGGEGIRLAYKVAIENLLEHGNNRVILCTDGDFNVGASSDNDMKDLIIESRNKGVFITVGGFGMGNYQDSKMETIADNGNGNYFYIDNYNEAEKVFNRDLRATLFTIAKDVKIQVEFNPKHVKAYRLIGYENRIMPPQDFNDDTKDGGELGAGHKVTALYEIIPANSDEDIPGAIELKYQKPESKSNADYGDEMLTIKLRYKKSNENISKLMTTTMNVSNNKFEQASEDFRFAVGVALYAQQLRKSKFVPVQDFSQAKSIIQAATSSDKNGEKNELLVLIDKATNIYQQSTSRD